MFIAGIVLVLIGLGLVFWSKKKKQGAAVMATTETSRVGDMLSLVQSVRDEMPGGGSSGYAEVAELKGTVACDAPLTGELSGQTAAICDSRVVRVVESRHEVRDSQGSVRTEWRKTEEVVSQNRREAVFYLDDGSGRVRVLTNGAKLELEKVVDRFEPPTGAEQGLGDKLTVGYGAFRVAVGAMAMATGGHRRTVGYRFEERILPVGRALYALGELADLDDGLVLRQPEKKGSPYLLSLKSEAELLASASKAARWLAVGGIALAVLGGVLAVIGLVR
ncbi:MAG: E3 ubiquitin ligase family protein [Myxococcota bacterium]